MTADIKGQQNEERTALTVVSVDQLEPSLVDPLAGIGIGLFRLSPSELRHWSKIWDYEIK